MSILEIEVLYKVLKSNRKLAAPIPAKYPDNRLQTVRLRNSLDLVNDRF
jgi:hypothetical protein